MGKRITAGGPIKWKAVGVKRIAADGLGAFVGKRITAGGLFLEIITKTQKHIFSLRKNRMVEAADRRWWAVFVNF